MIVTVEYADSCPPSVLLWPDESVKVAESFARVMRRKYHATVTLEVECDCTEGKHETRDAFCDQCGKFCCPKEADDFGDCPRCAEDRADDHPCGCTSGCASCTGISASGPI